MKNKEKFAEELLNIIICDETLTLDSLAFDVNENTVKSCSETNGKLYIACSDCLFGDVCNCDNDISDVRRKWLEEEYVEPTID